MWDQVPKVAACPPQTRAPWVSLTAGYTQQERDPRGDVQDTEQGWVPGLAVCPHSTLQCLGLGPGFGSSFRLIQTVRGGSEGSQTLPALSPSNPALGDMDWMGPVPSLQFQAFGK